MIRVANIHTDGRLGGPQNRMVQVAAGLASRGIETLVIGPRADSEGFRALCEQAGVRFRAQRLHRLTRERSHLLAYAICFVPELIGLVRALRAECVDLVHCNGAWQVKPILAGWLARKKVILHLNDTAGTRPLRLLLRLLGPLCDGFVFAGECVREVYRTVQLFHEVAGAVIQAPVDLARFDPAVVEPDAALAAHPGPRVLTVANLNPDKGLEHFVEAADQVCARFPDASFHVVGRPLESQRAYGERLRARARELAPERIFFHGPSREVPAMLAAADVYVCSSVKEASPMSLWEAMAMGRPIVSTRVGDVPRLIEHEGQGLLVPTRNPQALAEAVQRLISEPALGARLGRAARERAAERLDLSVCVDGHERFYRTLVPGGPEV